MRWTSSPRTGTGSSSRSRTRGCYASGGRWACRRASKTRAGPQDLRPHQRCAPVEARPQPDEADQVAGADAAALPALVEGDGDGGGGGVSLALDVVVDAVVGEAEDALDHLVDAQVRLVRDEQVDLRHLDALLLAELAHHLGHARHRRLEDGAAVHLGDVPPLADVCLIDVGTAGESGAGDVEVLEVGAVRVDLEAEQPLVALA